MDGAQRKAARKSCFRVPATSVYSSITSIMLKALAAAYLKGQRMLLVESLQSAPRPVQQALTLSLPIGGLHQTSWFSFCPGNAIGVFMISESDSYMKHLKLVCALGLAVSIFLAQGLQIHSHVYGHVPGQTDHIHQTTVHFDHVVAQGEAHPDEPAPIKVAKESVLKHHSFTGLLGILSATAFSYPPSLLLVRKYFSSFFHGGTSFDLGLSPPLRAPPQ